MQFDHELTNFSISVTNILQWWVNALKIITATALEIPASECNHLEAFHKHFWRQRN